MEFAVMTLVFWILMFLIVSLTIWIAKEIAYIICLLNNIKSGNRYARDLLEIAELQTMVAQLQADLANNQAVDLQPVIDKINNEVLPALQVLNDINPDQVA